MALRSPGVLRRALLWLMLLAPFFFLSYGLANWLAAQRDDVGTLAFSWERHIPLWPWTIVPYWSIDLLYGLSFLLPRRKRELDRHALRLLTAQVIAVLCFLLFPLRFSLARPPMDGAYGWLFDVLAGFDMPYNQAPSLHITLLVILWVAYARYATGMSRWLMHGWFALIGLSVLTTWQHHFIDLPTGVLLGWLCVWLWPDEEHEAPLIRCRIGKDSRRLQLSGAYGASALALSLLALIGGGAWLWLLWPAIALLLVALCYGVVGAGGFQKSDDGSLSLAMRWLMAPYLLGAWINSRWWTRHHPHPVEVLPGIWLGRLPSRFERGERPYGAVLDLCAELPHSPRSGRYVSLPLLDLIVPTADQCRRGAELIEELSCHGPVLVCCALGYSRSATVIAAWLLISHRASNPEQALSLLRKARPQVVISRKHGDRLAALIDAVSSPEGAAHAS